MEKLFRPRHKPLPAVHLAPVCDAGDKHQALIVVHGVHDPVFADSNPIVVPTGELGAALRAGVAGKAVDRSRDAVTQPAVEASVSTNRLRMQADFVAAPWPCGYVRTSDQGCAASRSSRA